MAGGELNLTVLFKRLGAPLANQRWSWGSVRPDGIVILRVWLDEIKKHDGVPFVRVTYVQALSELKASAGFGERQRHIGLIQDGASSLLIMCEAVDPRVIPRTINGFNQDELFEGGAVKEIDGDIWIEVGRRVPVSSIKLEAAT